ncbi:MAG: tripartite tricarboxylate transporter TctB family protein [Hyphomicrobiaceae bacterium]|nr:tripartite tricarboxylate transporter TctB family protein [Hyphomicrobiaceae bacterium]
MSSEPTSSDEENEGRTLVHNRAMDAAVAIVLIGLSALVIKDTLRLGVGWIEGQGPGSGYFPFYIACALGFASLVTLVQALMGKTDDASEPFVSVPAMGRILTVLLPSIGFVMLIGGLDFPAILGRAEPLTLIPALGIYVASAIFIFFFMVAVGREGILKSTLVSVGVPLALFFMFEKWFLVPLPKGPLEALLGLA